MLNSWWQVFKCPNFTTARTDNFDGWAVLTVGWWKLHKHENGTYELYDIETNLAETKDLVSLKKPDVVKELAAKRKEWQRSAEFSLISSYIKIEKTINLQ